jgi:uncharacterized membrane protein YedE/YeeE
MRLLIYILIGTFFGIVLAKAEIISWFRIVEMFRFESFHMYGVIGSAVVLGIISIAILKRIDRKGKEPFQFSQQEKSWKKYLFGGTIFGLGWAMTGACPGPLFINAGAGFYTFFIAIGAAILGTFCYGLLAKKLPH